MNRTFLAPLRAIAGACLLGLLSTGCTTDFDTTRLRPVDAGTDISAQDAVDVPVVQDVRDAPPMDTADTPVVTDSGMACGGENQPCCSTDGGAACPGGPLICTGGYCLRCPGMLSRCGDTCVDFSVNPRFCGRCEVQCAAGEVCTGGLCVLPCPSGQAQCGNQCVPIQSDLMHCGSCTTVCSTPVHAAALCASGRCGMGACETGFANCDGNAANGCETELATSLANCGACGSSCTFAHAVATCSMGTCSMGACEPGFGNCDGNPANGCEVSFNTAITNCGACGTICPTPTSGSAVCRMGTCGTSTSTCSAGTGNCDGNDTNGCETDLNTSVTNCGACGTSCTFAHAAASCAMGACQLGACDTGFGDCDGLSANGCETDLRSNLANCGACMSACTASHGSSECVMGRCQVGACEMGFANCDMNAANGCETDLNTSATHCGNCGSACALADAVSACSSGVCRLVMCNPGFADCDGNPANGCEVNLATDANNCGGCRTVCNVAHATAACSMRSCTVGVCAPGFGNCDGNASNGCEADLNNDPLHCGVCSPGCSFAHAAATCAMGVCVMGACAPGFANCDGNPANGCETDTTSDAAHCGSCTNACGSGQLCTAGTCSITCGAGLTMCGGTCVDLQTNLQNCRSCGNACPTGPNATASCSAGVCSMTCTPGFVDCDMNPANGCEANLFTSTANCGRCGRACNATNGTPVCSGSACSISCSSGFANCDTDPANGCEVTTSNNVNNCGSCLNVCPARANATPTCTSGACGFTCNTGFGDCDGNPSNGCEVNLLTSGSNCGMCGTRCNNTNTTSTCTNGSCIVTSCASGYANCDNLASNGCETNLNTSTSSCGMCGRSCSSATNATPTCATGTCGIRCIFGYGNCDMVAANGCETNIRTDRNNCGACGNRCSTGRGCSDGSCN